MQATGIEWTDFSANPLKYRDKASGKVVWACVKHSAGCKACYAEALALRYGRGGPFTKESMAKVEPFLDDKELGQLLKSPKLAGKRVFVGDMTDVFGEWVPDALLDKLFAVFALRPDVTFQVLTKRADRLKDYLNRVYARGSVADAAVLSFGRYVWWNTVGHEKTANEIAGPEWPLPNVWLGFSAENQAAWDSRLADVEVLAEQGWLTWCSAEPLLGPLNLGLGSSMIRWLVCGGESGPGARPCRMEWIRSIVEQCKAAEVACFVKQLGSVPEVPDEEAAAIGHQWQRDNLTGRHYTGRGNGDFVLNLRDRKGGDIEEWPEDLRVRQFPEVTHV